MNNPDLAIPRLVAVDDDDATGRDPACLLPGVITVEDTNSPGDMLNALALAAYTTGSQPHAATTHLDEVRPEVSLLPTGAIVVRSASGSHRDACLAAGDGWTIRTIQWRSGGADITVTATTGELARRVLDAATKDAVPERQRDDSTVSMGFWHKTSRHSSYRSARRVNAAAWAEIQANYSAVTAQALGSLMSVTADRITGRVILLHGTRAPARPPCCARSPASGRAGARPTACSTRRSCSPTPAISWTWRSASTTTTMSRPGGCSSLRTAMS